MILSGERSDSITTKEVARLSDWLQEHGHTPEEVLECIKSIANEKDPE